MTAVVLMYHRVATLADDAYGIAVRPDRFTEHVEHLAGLGCVVPLGEVLEPSRALRLAITFDDGYVDNATVADPLLAEAGLPATYFITTGRLGGRRFWWDRLATALLREDLPAGLDAPVAGRDLWLSLVDDRARRTALHFVHRRLRELPPGDLEAAVDALLDVLPADDAPADDLSMTDAQLRALAARPGVEIGAHTRTHLQLALHAEAVQREEVLGSVEDLTALLARPVTSFAYPFGGRSAVGEVAPRLTREAGCALACTTDQAAVAASGDAQRVPRLNVLDWTADELDAQVRALTLRS